MRISSVLLEQFSQGVPINGEFSSEAKPPPSAVLTQFARLADQEFTFQQGIADLQVELSELQQLHESANLWGTTAVICNTVLIPLNVIVNAMELKAANGALRQVYQEVAKALYKKNAASGTRNQGNVAKALGILKTAAIEALKSQGKKDLIPGVQMIVGLAEDSMALYQTMVMVDTGNRETAGIARQIAAQIHRMEQELRKIGVRRAELLRLAEQRSRTA